MCDLQIGVLKTSVKAGTIGNCLFPLSLVLKKLILRLPVCILLIWPMAPSGGHNQREMFPLLQY